MICTVVLVTALPLEESAICIHVCAQSLSHVCLFVTPHTVARQAPLSMEFSGQEFWRELPCPSPGICSDSARIHVSCIGRRILYHWELERAGKANKRVQCGRTLCLSKELIEQSAKMYASALSYSFTAINNLGLQGLSHLPATFVLSVLLITGNCSIPGLGRSPGEGKGYPLQYFGLENSMDCIVHGVTKSRTQLSDFHFVRY